VLAFNPSNYRVSGLIFGLCRDFQQVRIKPEKLRIDEIDPMLLKV
jgi:hypothetical protein